MTRRAEPAVPPAYTLIRSRRRRKTLALRIAPDGRAVVRAPWHTPRKEIDGFVARNTAWLRRKREKRAANRQETARSFVPGETFLHLGQPYPLDASDAPEAPPLAFSGSAFVLRRDCLDQAREILIAWYVQAARAVLEDRVAFFADALGLRPAAVRIGRGRSRWGSCSPGNRLTFSWRLVLAPPAVIDYVVVHELVHLKEKHHADPFWRAVAAVIPEYRDRRRWLRTQGHRLELTP